MNESETRAELIDLALLAAGRGVLPGSWIACVPVAPVKLKQSRLYRIFGGEFSSGAIADHIETVGVKA